MRSRSRKKPLTAELTLPLETGASLPVLWPSQARFPHNADIVDVDSTVDGDLRGSLCPFIVTSYTSLDRVVTFLARIRAKQDSDPRTQHEIKILLGHEPSKSRRTDFSDKRQRFQQEIRDYWLHRRISVARSAQVLAAIECLRSERTAVKTSGDRIVHAKIYITESAATIGSSNYSLSGMKVQAEANCRFTPDEDPQRYDELTQLARGIWNEGIDYRAGLIDLLEKLLRKVDWDEALGRAASELLEGVWTRDFLAHRRTSDGPDLWPTQVEGIAQALWVLENVGSVLVADATGSGKTKMGAQLLLAAQMRHLRAGIGIPDLTVVISPPAVKESWMVEATSAGVPIDVYSHGTLSNKHASARSQTIHALRRARILAFDEAHTYLNRSTARTQAAYRNSAEHVILFTATPINRGTFDLIAIMDLLGGDNFDSDILKVIARASTNRNLQNRLSAEELSQIRTALQRFTVRRTKSMLNRSISEAPEKYLNARGDRCRFPDHLTRVYGCGETNADLQIAAEMRSVASKLKGMLNLRSELRLPDAFAELISEKDYLAWRVNGARSLAVYQLFAALRSSRAALIEHLRGTEAVREMLNLSVRLKPIDTGNVLDRLSKIAGRVPRSALKSVHPPAWLADPSVHANACEADRKVYERILQLALELSPTREEAKARLLVEIFSKHKRVLAFDHYLVTLHDLRQRVQKLATIDVLLGTGTKGSERSRIEEALRLGSTSEAIGLCSDALAEGVNLQGASAVVLLDMPSVIRIAEQRIGRIDRMDSPYPEIEIFWPNDAEPFALRSNELFLDRVSDVDRLLGSNFSVPVEFGRRVTEVTVVTPADVGHAVEEYREDAIADSVQDAFQPVRDLVEGENALVSDDVYQSVRGTTVSILTAVSVVHADERWAFYAVAAGNSGVPRWIFIKPGEAPVTDLEMVASALRARLTRTTRNRDLDRVATAAIAEDMRVLQLFEEQMLPRRKRAAVELMKKVIRAYRLRAQPKDGARKEILRRLEKLISVPKNSGAEKHQWYLFESPLEEVLDWNILADWWFDQVRPAWQKHLLNRRRKTPARIRELYQELLDSPISTEQLESLFAPEIKLYTQPIANRVFAAIIGIPEGQADDPDAA
jgi:superfamily II DNA or RNA helicase